jgi:hypothetical protein
VTRDLPHPGTATEMYLAAVLDVLDDIRDRLGEQTPAVPDLAAPGDGEAGTVELTEPAQPAPSRQARPRGRPQGKKPA